MSDDTVTPNGLARMAAELRRLDDELEYDDHHIDVRGGEGRITLHYDLSDDGEIDDE